VAGLVPDHYYKVLCQNARCHVALGGLHMPCVGGFVLIACHKCGFVSYFRNEAFGISQFLLDRHGNQLDPKDPRRILAQAGAPPAMSGATVAPSPLR
jgi:hypothetical protein